MLEGLPEDLQFELVEPLKELFKDEVREIGIKLGLPKKMLYRHPFPGPGLGVRILGPVKEEFAEILRKADHIFMEELNNQKLYDKVDQAFAVFLPVKSVGVTGDERRYDYVIALRAVETIDFMTARWARLPYEFLDHVSNRIMNEISRVSRVVYDISGKPPSTIEWEYFLTILTRFKIKLTLCFGLSQHYILEMLSAFLTGQLFLGLSLIVAIGAQNAFVIRSGILKNHIFYIALFCAISDSLLIILGIAGISFFLKDFINEFSNIIFGFSALWLFSYGLLRIRSALIYNSIAVNNNPKSSSLLKAISIEVSSFYFCKSSCVS